MGAGEHLAELREFERYLCPSDDEFFSYPRDPSAAALDWIDADRLLLMALCFRVAGATERAEMMAERVRKVDPEEEMERWKEWRGEERTAETPEQED